MNKEAYVLLIDTIMKFIIHFIETIWKTSVKQNVIYRIILCFIELRFLFLYIAHTRTLGSTAKDRRIIEFTEFI